MGRSSAACCRADGCADALVLVGRALGGPVHKVVVLRLLNLIVDARGVVDLEPPHPTPRRPPSRRVPPSSHVIYIYIYIYPRAMSGDGDDRPSRRAARGTRRRKGGSQPRRREVRRRAGLTSRDGQVGRGGGATEDRRRAARDAFSAFRPTREHHQHTPPTPPVEHRYRLSPSPNRRARTHKERSPPAPPPPPPPTSRTRYSSSDHFATTELMFGMS